MILLKQWVNPQSHPFSFLFHVVVFWCLSSLFTDQNFSWFISDQLLWFSNTSLSFHPSPWLCTGSSPVWWVSVTTSSFVLLRFTKSSNCKFSRQTLRTETCCLHSSPNTASKYTEYCKYTLVSGVFVQQQIPAFKRRCELIDILITLNSSSCPGTSFALGLASQTHTVWILHL